MSASVLQFAILAVVSLLIVVTIVGGLGGMLHVGSRIRREPFPLLFWLIAIVVVAGPVMAQRNLSAGFFTLEADPENLASSLWINRACSVLIALIAAERILRFVVGAADRARFRAWGMLGAVAVYSVTNHFLNAALGTVPSFSHHAVYALLVSVAAILVAVDDWQRCLRAARDALVAILSLGALLAVVRPEIVIESNYAVGLLPMRYWGLGTHANVLSQLVVLLLALLLVVPYRARWAALAAWTLGLASLVATQSKTALLGVTVCLVVVLAYGYRQRHGRAAWFRHPALPAAAIVATLLALGSALALQLAFDLSRRFEIFLGTDAGERLATLTDRSLIWSYAMREWQHNPWFGYGPGLFGEGYREAIGLRMAFHAHNQFVQSLGAAGLVGLAGLAGYFVVLGRYAWRAAPATNGISLALFLFVALRCITEVPLTLRAVTIAEFFSHLTLVILCVGLGSPRPAERRRPWTYTPRPA